LSDFVAQPAPFRCGMVAVVGRPNVGKSTLVNRLLGQKVSITARRPQTTRHQILGIRTAEAFQAIYVDTPGLHTGGGRALNRYMNRAAAAALREVDVILLVVEALRWRDADSFVLGRVQDRNKAAKPVLLAVNKVDRLPEKGELLPYLEACAQRASFAELVPLSAERGDNVDTLERLVVSYLPQAEPMFPEDQVTDRTLRLLAAELVREKLTRTLGQELPYRVSVEIERFAESGRYADVAAVIWVERESQKAIVIGKQGARLKRVGTQARRELEDMLETHVHLELWVKVKPEWPDDESALRELGYK